QLFVGMVSVVPFLVRLEVAAVRRPCHERGEALAARGLDLARILAELGRDPREPERSVHVLLSRPGDAGARVLVEDAILAHGERLTPRQLADPDVVILRAREVLQRGAEGVGL